MDRPDAPDRRHTLSNGVVAVIWGVLGFVLVVWANDVPRLPAPHADSMSYMEAARSLVASGTLETPFVDWAATDQTSRLVHFPPGVSVLMAVPLWMGLDPLGAATMVMASSAAVLLGVMSLFGAWSVGGPARWIVPGFVLVSPELARLHVGIWSEPAFLAVGSLAVIAMWKSPQRRLTYGLLAAVATAIRYAGIPLVVLSALVAARTAPKGARLGGVLVAGGPGAVFFVVWMWWSSAGPGSVRSTGLYTDGLGGQLMDGVRAAAAWGWPGGSLLLGLGVIVSSVVATIEWRRFRPWTWTWARPWAVAALYLGFIGLSRVVADPHIPFDQRLLAPVMVGWLALVGSLVSRGVTSGSPWRVPLAAFLVVWMGVGASQIHRGVASVRSDGLLYSSSYWDASPVFAALSTKPAQVAPTVYSNEPELLLFRTGVHARRMPRAGVPYDRDLLMRRLDEPDVTVVLVPPFRRGELDPAQLMAGTHLEIAVSGPQGWVLSRGAVVDAAAAGR